jgi:trimeric autotransporter adhesin
MKTLVVSLLILCYFLFIPCNAQIIVTCAGNGTAGYSGNGGQATAAELYNPNFVILDVSGNLYIGDTHNNVVRKVTTSGVITTFAGNGTSGYLGDGGQATAAEFDNIEGMVFDASGNLYIADMQNNRIRKVNTTGVISTFAGNGTAGYSGGGGQATSAELDTPDDVAIDASGQIYIADDGNQRIRRVGTQVL